MARWSIAPPRRCPMAATLLTFIDVTDGVNVERALTERNQALLAAEQLRNDFVHHVSYELRSPLTNIIGFIQLARRRQRRPAQRQAARICRLCAEILGRAAGDHQRHSRSRHASTATRWNCQLGEVDIAASIARSRRGRAGPAGGIACRAVDRRRAGHRRLPRRRPSASGRFCSTCSPTPSAFPSRARRSTLAALRRDDEIVFKVSRPGARHPAGTARPCLRPFRKPHTAQFAPSRRRPRPVDRARLRRTARRRGA